MFGILASTGILAPGSFDFSAQGYTKASFWTPEDGIAWEDFKSGRFSSVEDLKAKRACFEAQLSDKLEIVDHHYSKRSLRTLLPDHWLVAYTRDQAWREVNGKKTPLYSQLKQTLFFKSVVLGYGEGPIHNSLPNKEIAKFIKEHCASAARLKAIALRSYESVANVMGYGTWTSVSPPIFLSLAAAKSSLDAMSAVLWALLFQEIPQKPNRKTKTLEPFFPSMWDLYNKLREKNNPFQNQFAKLYRCSWYSKLQNARDKVIHRSGGPVVHDEFGAAFDFDLGIFREMKPNSIQAGKPRVRMEKNMKCIHLDKIMKGFVIGLEKWEVSVARKLQKLACFSSLNTDGILLGVEFNDNNLLRDGYGPSRMITSHAQ